MDNLYPHVVSFFNGQVWALTREKLDELRAFVALKAGGGVLGEEDLRAVVCPPRAETAYDIGAGAWSLVGASGSPSARGSKGVIAILPVYGVLSQRAGMISEASGGTSLEKLQARFRAVVSDPGVRAVVLDVDSPGGTVRGTMELAEEIRGARGQKPIAASVNGQAGSAAYWLASQADSITASPSSDVGSIGVFLEHVDTSKAEEQAGIKTTLISAGKYKTEGNPHEPMSAEAMDYWQGRVDELYSAFVAAVAKGRGVGPETVRRGYGQGRMLGARAALDEGMIDKLGSLDDVVQRLAGRSAAPAVVQAQADHGAAAAEVLAARDRIRTL